MLKLSFVLALAVALASCSKSATNPAEPTSTPSVYETKASESIQVMNGVGDIRILGQSGTCVRLSDLNPEWQVFVRAEADLALRVVNFYSPQHGCQAYTDGAAHGVPATGGHQEYYAAGETGTTFYRLDKGTTCGRQQYDLIVHGRNSGWLIVDAGVDCAPPPVTPPPTADPICPTPDRSVFSYGPEWEQVAPDKLLVSFTVRPGPSVKLTLASFQREVNENHTPQNLYHSSYQVFEGGETYRKFLPIQSCQAQADIFACWGAPQQYNESNRREWDAKVIPQAWWWNTVPCQ